MNQKNIISTTAGGLLVTGATSAFALPEAVDTAFATLATDQGLVTGLVLVAVVAMVSLSYLASTMKRGS